MSRITKLYVAYRLQNGTTKVTDMCEPASDHLYQNIWGRAESLAASKSWTVIGVYASKREANKAAQ